MEFSEDLTDHRGALFVGSARGEPQLMHSVENPAMDRLQAVPDVREGPLHDDAHGVVDERLPHLVLEESGLHVPSGASLADSAYVSVFHVFHSCPWSIFGQQPGSADPVFNRNISFGPGASHRFGKHFIGGPNK